MGENILNSHSISPRPGVLIGTGEYNTRGHPAMDCNCFLVIWLKSMYIYCIRLQINKHVCLSVCLTSHTGRGGGVKILLVAAVTTRTGINLVCITYGPEARSRLYFFTSSLISY